MLVSTILCLTTIMNHQRRPINTQGIPILTNDVSIDNALWRLSLVLLDITKEVNSNYETVSSIQRKLTEGDRPNENGEH